MNIFNFWKSKKSDKKTEDFSIYGGGGGYAAGLSRVEDNQQNQFANANSDDTNIVTDYETVKRRMKALSRNNIVANAIVNNIKTSTIQGGFKISADVPNEKDLNDLIESEWKKFSATIDASGEYTLDEMVSIAFDQMLVSGDCFGLIVGTGSDEYKTKVRLIDADRVANPYAFKSSDKDKNITLGIEKDSYGDKKAIYILKEHPENNIGSQDYFRRTIKDKNGLTQVCHLYSPKIISQTRGLPLLTHSYYSILDLDLFVKTELNAAKNSSNWNMVIKTPFAAERASQLNAASSSKKEPNVRPKFYNSPGAINVLQPGEEVQQIKLERPSGMFSPFVIAQLKTICASLGLSYAYLFRDGSELNYAASRFDALQNQIVLKNYQEIIVRRFLNPIRDMFIMEFVSKFNPNVDIETLKNYVHFIAPSFQILDITKELTASKLAIETGLSNLQVESLKYGVNDYEGVLQQLGREIEQKKEYGITPSASEVGINQEGDVQPNPNQRGRIAGQDSTLG